MATEDAVGSKQTLFPNLIPGVIYTLSFLMMRQMEEQELVVIILKQLNLLFYEF
jgi:hypothetical protein